MTAAALPVPDAEPYVAYSVTTSSTGPFAVPFPLPTSYTGALHVAVDGEELESDEFTFTPDEAVSGGYPTGEIDLVAAVENATIAIWRDIPVARVADYGAGPLDFVAINAELMRLTAQLQDVRRQVARAVRLPDSEAPTTPIEVDVDDAGRLLGRSDDGASWEFYGNEASADTVAASEGEALVSFANRFSSLGMTPEDFEYGLFDAAYDQLALQAFFDALAAGTKGRGRFNKRTYSATSAIAIAAPTARVIEWENPIGAALSFESASGTGSDSWMTFGSPTGLTDIGASANPLEADVTEYSRTINLNNSIDLTSYQPGDRIIIMDTSNYSLTGGVSVDGSETYYRQGWSGQIESIAAGNVITTTRPIYGSYTTANANIRVYIAPSYKYNFHGGGEIIFKEGHGNSGLALYDGYGANVGLRMRGTQYGHLYLIRTLGGDIDVDIRDYQANVTANWGVVMYGSVNTWLADTCHIDVPRHSVSLSAGNQPGYAPNRFCGVRGGYYRSRVSYALDMHGPADRCAFYNPIAHGGVCLGGSRSKLWGGEVHSILAGAEIGTCVSIRDRVDSNIKIGGGVTLHQEAALDAGNAMLELESLGIMNGGRVLLDGVEFMQDKANSGTRAAARIGLNSGSDREVELVMKNLTGSVAEGVTATTHNVDIIGQTDARFKRIVGENWTQLQPRFTNVRAKTSRFANINCEGATQEPLLVLADDVATERMDVSISPFDFRGNAGGGLRIGGSTKGDNVRVFARAGKSVEHASANDTTAQDRGAIEVVNCAEALLADMDVGDGVSETVTFSSSSGLLMTTTVDVPTYSQVVFSNSGGALPTGLTAGTVYYTIRVSATTSRLATSRVNAEAATAIAYTDAGTGTTTALYQTMTRRIVATNVGKLWLPPSIRSRSRILADVLSGVDEIAGTAPVLIAASAVAVALTGTTSETALATNSIKGRAMGPNGFLEVETTWSWTNSANNKTPRVRLGGIAGTAFQDAVATTTGHGAFRRIVANRNSNSSQVGSFATSITNSYSVGSGGAPTGSVNTALDQDLVITGQLANSGETMTLEGYRIWLTYRP